MKKTAVVTGANRGIGLAFCKALLTQNYHVVALCRKSSHELEKLPLLIRENIHVDQLETLQKTISNLDLAHVDLLINNAGIGHEDSLITLNLSHINQHFITNALGALALTVALLPAMNVGAKVALISSRLASITNNQQGGSYAYRMSKAALNAMGKNLALDLKTQGIALAILSPGMVDTDMLRVLGIHTGADALVVVKQLLAILDNLNLTNSGTFWHVDGSVMPW